MSPFSEAPAPDKQALIKVGEHVRQRLDAEPRAVRIDTDKADIWAVGDMFDAQECRQLIAMIDRTAVPSQVLTHGEIEVWRTSSSGDVDPFDPFIQRIEERIDALLDLPHEWGETMQGQRYDVGQEFKYHLDSFWTKADYWQDEAKRGGQRTITAMAYLNNVEEGGDTLFTTLGLSIKPQRGALLIWNNNLPTGLPNEFTMHAGTPVVKGVKYVLTKWYRSRRWGY
ncbi:MAG TPA: 2OG-Fe(II) oxygenase [Novosphingobium sp.]|nr:2OG-Fe(II) oxygenase [Novosphingobium sp.]